MNAKKILVVDDEVAILEIMAEFFKMKGYAVSTAKTAEEALIMLGREAFMVMFLDLKLPDMDGITLCKRIRRDNLIAVIYAITGYTNFYNLMDCRAAGFDDFFVKPVDMNTLLKAADDAFEKIERWKVEKYDLM
ncbi:MAG TPA: response regulator [Syntrophorhabdaceae bacterium]|nr:response regulator [Syntrophorhabdaceae bacterium]